MLFYAAFASARLEMKLLHMLCFNDLALNIFGLLLCFFSVFFPVSPFQVTLLVTLLLLSYFNICLHYTVFKVQLPEKHITDK